MATIVKTDSGRWKALVRRRGWPTTAKTFRVKRDAQDWARAVEDDMRRGVYVPSAPAERLTLSDALDTYLDDITALKRPGTQAGERTAAAALRRALGQYSLAALTPDKVAAYRDQRLATISARTGRPISANTVRLELALLGHLYETAIREWQLGLVNNPVRHVRKPSPGVGRNRRLTWSEVRRLLRACDVQSQPMFGWIVRLAIATAMRKSEITNLRVGDVDLARRIVRLHDTKNREPRTVPLSCHAARVLTAAIKNPARPKAETDLIFPGEPGRDKERRPYRFEPAWQDAVRSAGLVDLRFHDLRHEAVSRLVERGLSDQEVSAISGHKSMQMLRRYTHLRAEDLVARLDDTRGRRRDRNSR